MQVESARLEFKKSWSAPTLDQIVKTICAFANDFLNLNGGYVILGIDTQDGRPVLPPQGLLGEDLDKIQREIRGQCQRIDPEYQPVLSPETYQGQPILVIWVPPGDLRPYRAPTGSQKGDRAYYIRPSSTTVEAKGEILTELMQLTARIPFDDRRNLTATTDNLSLSLVRRFLSNVKSDLATSGQDWNDADLYKRLRLSVPINGFEAPKNVALLFFTEDPERYFAGVRVEVVQLGDDAGGDLIEEKVFRGPLDEQIRQSLDYLNGLSTTLIRKIPGQAETLKTVAFPYEAMEEALVNAVYHRSYEIGEPVKVYLYPDRMEIISYPGPVPGISQHHFERPGSIPPVPNRNRRIGEFLKELRLAEGRGTGIPKIHRKMQENGSPAPGFDFDDERTYFRVILLAHPQYVAIHALRESAHLWAIGEKQRAVANLESALSSYPSSGEIVSQLIEYKAALGDLAGAEAIFRHVIDKYDVVDRRPYMAIAKAFLDAQSDENVAKARRILSTVPSPHQISDTIELAILYKRANRLQSAHRIFANNYDLIKNDPKAIHEYAQIKMKLAAESRDRDTKRQLNREAVELLRRTIQLSDNAVRSAWSWYDLARSLRWLNAPKVEIEQAIKRAIQLLPDEKRFNDWYRWWQNTEGPAAGR